MVDIPFLAVIKGNRGFSIKPAIWKGNYTLRKDGDKFPMAHGSMSFLMKVWERQRRG